MITFTINNLHQDVPRVKDKFDRLLRIVGDFSIRVDSRILYGESEFPFVEFATQLTKWLAAGGHQDFSYDSVESDDPGLVWFRRSGEQWKVVRYTRLSRKTVPSALMKYGEQAYNLLTR